MPRLTALAALCLLAAWPDPARGQAGQDFKGLQQKQLPLFLRLQSGGDEVLSQAMEAIDREDLPGRFLPKLAWPRHPRLRAFLIERLGDPRTLDATRASRLRLAAIEGLMLYPPDDEIAAAIAGRLRDESRPVQEAAARATALLAHPASLPAVLSLADERPRGSDWPAYRILARIGGPAAMAKLVERLDPQQAFMPWFGAVALEAARHGRRELLPLLLQAASRAARGNSVDDGVLRALGLFRDRQATPTLREVVRRQSFRQQYWAAVALGDIADPAALEDLRAAFPAVREWPASPRWENEAAIAYARARLGDAEGRRVLEKLAADPAPDPALRGLLFLMRLEGKARAAAFLEKLRLYRDVESGCPRHWQAEEIADALIALDAPEVDTQLVEIMRWRHGCGVPRALERRFEDSLHARHRRALETLLRSADVDTADWAGVALVDSLGDPCPVFARLAQGASLPTRVLAVRYLGLNCRAGHGPVLEAARRDPAWQVVMEAEFQRRRSAGGGLAPDAEATAPRLEAGPRVGYTAGLAGRGKVFAKEIGAVEASWVRRLARLPDGRLAAATQTGLAVYDGLSWRNLGQAAGLCSDQTYDVLVRGSRVLVAGVGGMAEGDGQRFTCHAQLAPGKILRLAAAGARVYLGTDSGVFAWEAGRAQPLGGPQAAVNALAVEPGGALWVALHDPGIHDRRASLPGLQRLEGGRWRALEAPLQHFFGREGLQRLLAHGPVFVTDLAVDRQGRVLLGTSFGVLRHDRGRFENLSLLGGNHPWHAVNGLAVDGAGRVFASQIPYLEVLEGGTWRRLPVVETSAALGLTELGSRAVGSLLVEDDGVWAGLGRATQCVEISPTPPPADADMVRFHLGALTAGSAFGTCSLVRWLDRDRARRALPPETVISSLQAGGILTPNPDVGIGMPDQARRFMGGEAVRVQTNVVTVTAVAKDPWDYGPVEYRFKFDEGDWTPWSDRNALITPNILDEGVHRVQVQARDREGNVDPTPAEMRFTVFTKELTILKIQDGQFERVFPSQYLRYQQDGLGKVQLQNLQDQPVEVDLELKVEDLFEKPARVAVTLAPHEKRWVSVPAPFSEALLRSPSQRVAQAVVEARFAHEGVDRSTRRSFSVELMEANAFSWERPERLASFIHAGDPAVERLAAEVHRALAAAHPGEARQAHPLRGYLVALYAYEALRALGVGYKPDPARPFRGLRSGAMDSVLFPGQTLARRGGDCDDLVVLFCSLLENLGVATLVAPVPGHVYMLLDTGVLKANRAAFPVDARKTVVRAGRLWLPVEVTLLGKGKPFAAAWAAGAEAHLGKYRPKDSSLVAVREAWGANPPARLAEQEAPAAGPALDLAAVADQAREVLGRQRVEVEKLAPAGEGREALLQRGEALVKAGLFPEAAQSFSRALAEREDHRGQYGLGTAHAGQGDALQALVCFQKALALAQDRQQRFRCLLAMAQCHKVNGNLTKARKHLEEALALNPAARFDGRYAALVKFVELEEGTKASGEDESPPFFQVMLLP